MAARGLGVGDVGRVGIAPPEVDHNSPSFSFSAFAPPHPPSTRFIESQLSLYFSWLFNLLDYYSPPMIPRILVSAPWTAPFPAPSLLTVSLSVSHNPFCNHM